MNEEIPSEKPVDSHPNAVQSPAAPENDSSDSLPKIESFAPDYHKKPKRKKRPFLMAVMILLLAPGAIYWFLLRSEPAVPPTKSNNSAQPSSGVVAETKHHNSTNFNLGFDYPAAWTVLDDDTSEDPQISVISPKTKLKDASGKEIDGKIIMYIIPDAKNLKELEDKEPSEALLDSEKITYTKPTETQRGSTYISFLNYTTSSAPGIDGIYITGDNGYKKEQLIPKVDILKSDPIIRVVFNECPDSGDCEELGSIVTISTDSWQDSEFSGPIKTMLESLAIQ